MELLITKMKLHSCNSNYKIICLVLLIQTFCYIDGYSIQRTYEKGETFLFRGIVEDYRQNRTFSNVKVYTNHNKAGVTTNSDGEFSILVSLGDSVYVRKDTGHSFWVGFVDDHFVDKNKQRIKHIGLIELNILKLSNVKEIAIDGQIYATDILKKMPIDIGFWGICFDPQGLKTYVIQSEKNKDNGLSPWILVNGKDTTNLVRFLRKRDWGIE